MLDEETKKELLNDIEGLENVEKSKEDRILDFVKAIQEIEYAIEPFKEHKKDLKRSYQENGWLTREDIRVAIKAMKMLKEDEDLDQLIDFYETLRKRTGLKHE